MDEIPDGKMIHQSHSLAVCQLGSFAKILLTACVIGNHRGKPHFAELTRWSIRPSEVRCADKRVPTLTWLIFDSAPLTLAI